MVNKALDLRTMARWLTMVNISLDRRKVTPRCEYRQIIDSNKKSPQKFAITLEIASNYLLLLQKYQSLINGRYLSFI